MEGRFWTFAANLSLLRRDSRWEDAFGAFLEVALIVDFGMLMEIWILLLEVPTLAFLASLVGVEVTRRIRWPLPPPHSTLSPLLLPPVT